MKMTRVALLFFAAAMACSGAVISVPGPVFAPAPAGGGPWAYVQSTELAQSGSSSTIAKAYAANVAAGSLLFCVVSWDPVGGTVGAPSVADTFSQTWTQIGSALTAGFFKMAVFYLVNTSGGANTVTATFSAATTTREISIIEYSGIATSSALDQTAGQSQTPGTGTDAATSGNVTTTAANELICVAGVSQCTSTGTFDTGTGFTSRSFIFDGTWKATRIEDKNLASAGSTSGTFTANFASDSTAVIIATFKQ